MRTDAAGRARIIELLLDVHRVGDGVQGIFPGHAVLASAGRPGHRQASNVLHNATAARAPLVAATDEQTLVLASLYQRNGTWRFRAVGQGYEFGLATLAVRHGIDVEQD